MGSGDAVEGIPGPYSIGCGIGRAGGGSARDADDLSDAEVVGIQARIGGQDGIDCHVKASGDGKQGISGLDDIGYAARWASGRWYARDADGLPDLEPVGIDARVNGHDGIDRGVKPLSQCI